MKVCNMVHCNTLLPFILKMNQQIELFKIKWYQYINIFKYIQIIINIREIELQSPEQYMLYFENESTNITV